MFTLLADWRSEDPHEVEDDWKRMLEAHRRYEAYLAENRARFPESAFAFASAEWRNDFSDHRAPHDSWITDIHFNDGALPRFAGSGSKDLNLVLLGAYHDGHLHLRYRDVQSFNVAATGLIEIYRDEVRLSECGHVLHEIEFLGNPNWLIVCSDIEWEWRPLSSADG